MKLVIANYVAGNVRQAILFLEILHNSLRRSGHIFQGHIVRLDSTSRSIPSLARPIRHKIHPSHCNMCAGSSEGRFDDVYGADEPPSPCCELAGFWAGEGVPLPRLGSIQRIVWLQQNENVSVGVFVVK